MRSRDVDSSLPLSPLVLTVEGSDVTGMVTVTDLAGNIATFTSAAFKIDKTAPSLSWGTATPPANSAGWNNTDVSVPYTVDDALSGVDTSLPPSPLVPTVEGSDVTRTVTVTDLAGNTATFTSPAFKIDKTAPTLSWEAPTPPANLAGWNNTDVSVPYYGGRCALGGGHEPSTESLGANGRGERCNAHSDGYRLGREHCHVHFTCFQDRQDSAHVELGGAHAASQLGWLEQHGRVGALYGGRCALEGG